MITDLNKLFYCYTRFSTALNKLTNAVPPQILYGGIVQQTDSFELLTHIGRLVVVNLYTKFLT